MNAFWEIVVSNSLLVVVLAAVIAVVGRFWRNPAGLHLLWLLVLLKFVTPPLLTVPIHLPPNRPVIENHVAATLPDKEPVFPVDEKVADSEPNLAPPSLDQEHRLPLPRNPLMPRCQLRYRGWSFWPGCGASAL